jgi:hypothetical protein
MMKNQNISKILIQNNILATDKIGNRCRIALGDYQHPAILWQ